MRFSRREVAGTLAGLLLAAACGAPATRGGTGGTGRRTDAQSAALMLLAGNATIGLTRVAAARSYDDAVLAFAERERTDHSAMNAALTDLLARLDVEAVEDDRVRAMRDATTRQRERLLVPTGREFDVAYVEAALQEHRELLALLDDLQRTMLRPLLLEHVAALRPVLAAHAAHAEQLRGTLTARE